MVTSPFRVNKQSLKQSPWQSVAAEVGVRFNVRMQRAGCGL